VSRREDIDTAIWSDPDFEVLSAEASLLYIWSWTNTRCGWSGIYKVSVRAMTESKLTPELVSVALAELDEAKFAFYEAPLLWVRTRVKHIRSKSPQMAQSILKDLRSLPPKHPLVVGFMNEYRSDKWLRDYLSEAYREGIGNLSEKSLDKGNSHTLSVGSPEPPRTGEGTGSVKGEDEGSGEKENPPGKITLPAGFPAERLPHLRATYKVLRDLAEHHHAKAVNPTSLARVFMGRNPKPFVRAVHDFAAWADDQPSTRKDVIAGYRNWLDKTDDLAALEVLDEAGHPVTPKFGRSTGSSVQSSREFLADRGVAA
jgi:hypothetical protein